MHLVYQIYILTYGYGVFRNSTLLNISKCHFYNAICIKIANKFRVGLHGRGGGRLAIWRQKTPLGVYKSMGAC